MGSHVHNLTFHGVGVPLRELAAGEATVWLTEERFVAVLDAIEGREDVRISFDDGNRSDVDVALPALLERRLSATFFVLAGRLDHPEHLAAEDVERLVDAGMTIGSHGLHHRSWRQLDEQELAAELNDSRRVLSEIAGSPVTGASVPFGAYDRHVLARLRRRTRYERVFTSDGGRAREGAWLQPRTSVTVDDAPEVLATVPTRAVAAQRRVKRIVKRWR
jgi:peptidoglycan/xylan/chitin deacetylase (PgdA/CDA1 family)